MLGGRLRTEFVREFRPGLELCVAELPVPVFYRDHGTIFVWDREDSGEALRLERVLASRHSQAYIQRIERARVAELEPALAAQFSQAFYIPGEAQVDNLELLRAVAIALEESEVECHWRTRIVDGELLDTGTVVDCRGMGAKCEWPTLRGVRGEIVRLHAPEIELHHMVRLLHPLCPVYIVPRANGRLIVGATSIESDDHSPASVRGVLELLTSAYSVLPALAEARILEFNTQVRPCLPDNLPAFHFDRKRNVLSINGLYRHGFLLTPTVVEEALTLLSIPGSSTFVGRWSCLHEKRSATVFPVTQDEVQTCLSSCTAKRILCARLARSPSSCVRLRHPLRSR